MYQIWNESVDMPRGCELKTVKSERVTIKPFEPQADGYIFLHGVALARFKGRMYCSWAHNKLRENADGEEVNFAFSDDGGKTWSDFVKGNMAPTDGIAVSHGVFLVHKEQLYFFAPQFKGQMGAQMLKMGVYRLNEETGAFAYLGVALDDRFWPMCEPVLMENGNYLMSGIYVGKDFRCPTNAAAVAISRGEDILHWDIVKVEKKENVRVWGECTVVVNGSRCGMYCRDRSGKRVALYSESEDFGQTWSVMDFSNLPMIDSKPYAGTLSDGRRYLICSVAKDIGARDPLTIALADKGEERFNQIYCIDKGKTLSYPYAVEIDKKLYVAYSSTTEDFNRNSAELAIIDIEDMV